MDFKEYLVKFKKAAGPKNHKVRNSYGIYDAFKYYRKNKPPAKKFVLTEGQFYKIIGEINQKVMEPLFHGHDVKFPCLMGGLELRYYKIEPRLNSKGKLVYNAKIDWDATARLWHENPQARANKIILKYDERDNYKIFYNKNKARYKNKSYFNLKTHRKIRVQLSQAIKNNQIKGAKIN